MLRRFSKKLVPKNDAGLSVAALSDEDSNDEDKLELVTDAVNAVSYSLSVLKENLNKEDGSHADIRILNDLVQENPLRYGEILAKAGGIKLLLAASKQYPHAVQLQLHILDIFVAVAESSWSAIDKKAIKMLCVLLETYHSLHVQLHKSASTLLLKLVHKNQPIGKKGVQTLVHYLEITFHDVDAFGTSFFALNQAAQNRHNWEGICKPRVFSALLISGVAFGSAPQEHFLNYLNYLISFQMAYRFQNGRGVDPSLFLGSQKQQIRFFINRSGLVVPTVNPKRTGLTVTQIMTAMEKNEHRWEVQYTALMALFYWVYRNGVEAPTEVATKVLSCMERHLHVPAIQTAACVLLWPLGLNSNATVLARILTAVSLSLCHHRDNAWVRTAAVATVRGLLLSVKDDEIDIPNGMAFQIICQELTGVIAMEGCDWFTRHWAIMLLSVILHKNDPPRTVDDATVLRNSISMLDDPTITPRIRDSILTLLRLVVCHRGKAEAFLAENGVTAVAKLLVQQDGGISTTSVHIAASILNWLISKHYKLNAIDEKICIYALATCLYHNLYRDDKNDEFLIVNSLSSLVSVGILCKIDFLQTPGGVEAVIRVAESQSTDTMTRFFCFSILWGLVAFGWAPTEVITAVGSTAAKFATVINKRQVDGELEYSCCFAMTSVLRLLPQGFDPVLNAGGMEALAWCLKQNEACLTHTLEALHHVSAKRVDRWRWTRSGAIGAVLFAMAKYGKDRNVQEKGLEILRNVAGEAVDIPYPNELLGPTGVVESLMILREGGFYSLYISWIYFGNDEAIQKLIIDIFWYLLRAFYLHAWLWRFQMC